MKTLTLFKEEPFIQALKGFFQDLQVPVNYIADEPGNAAAILGDKYKPNDSAHKLIDDVYVMGMVDDAIFEGNKTFSSVDQLKALQTDYDGILILGVTLKQREGDLLPTRSQLAGITRVFNQTFAYTPVTVVFKYGRNIAFANSERIKYKQEWREGEKAGKVSLLKDVDLVEPHRGHLSILDQLRIEAEGKNAIRSFAQLYYYWQAKFSISVLNKTFYQEIIGWFNKAIQDIRIPSKNPGSEQHKDFAVRLIARLIFIWFLKELKVVKEELLVPEFNNGDENDLIKPNTAGTSYYKFILQNLIIVL